MLCGLPTSGPAWWARAPPRADRFLRACGPAARREGTRTSGGPRHRSARPGNARLDTIFRLAHELDVEATYLIDPARPVDPCRSHPDEGDRPSLTTAHRGASFCRSPHLPCRYARGCLRRWLQPLLRCQVGLWEGNPRMALARRANPGRSGHPHAGLMVGGLDREDHLLHRKGRCSDESVRAPRPGRLPEGDRCDALSGLDRVRPVCRPRQGRPALHAQPCDQAAGDRDVRTGR